MNITVLGSSGYSGTSVRVLNKVRVSYSSAIRSSNVIGKFTSDIFLQPTTTAVVAGKTQSSIQIIPTSNNSLFYSRALIKKTCES